MADPHSDKPDVEPSQNSESTGRAPLFTPDTSVYENRDAVKDSYSPDKIVGRDDEIEDYMQSLQPVINGEEPDNIFVYGKTGVGKTAVTEYLTSELSQSASHYDIELSILKISCKGANTSYQTAIRLVNECRSSNEQLSQAGHAEWKVYEALWEELDALGGTILIVLDEIDNIRDDELLYQLSRARGENNVTECKLGVIGISNELTYRDRLNAEVRSSLGEKTVFFPPYDATELRDVLQRRANLAFKEGALSPGVLQLCAAFGAKDSGDARKAITLLRESGDLARNENAEQVTEDHVQRARETVEIEEVVEGIGENLSENEQLTLYALATLTAQSATPSRTRRVYERYTQLANAAGREPVSNRRIRDFLAELESMNIVQQQQRSGGTNGNYNEHELVHDVGDVLRGLTEILEAVGVHDSVTQYVTFHGGGDGDTIITEDGTSS